MRKKTTWADKYRGIGFSVASWHTEGIGECWAYYLYIKLVQIPEDIRERFWLEPKTTDIKSMPITYDYYGEPFVSGLDWHGEITYYSKAAGIDGEPRAIKIGCDYQHYFDEGHYYNSSIVTADAKNSIDALHKLVPGILKWCGYCGDYFRAPNDERWCPVCEKKEKKRISQTN